MRSLFIILGFLLAILGLALSILPFGPIAYIPIILALIFGYIGLKAAKNEGKSTGLAKLVLILTIIALGITVYRSIFDENIVEDDIETIQNEEESLEDAKKELEDIEIDE